MLIWRSFSRRLQRAAVIQCFGAFSGDDDNLTPHAEVDVRDHISLQQRMRSLWEIKGTASSDAWEITCFQMYLGAGQRGLVRNRFWDPPDSLLFLRQGPNILRFVKLFPVCFCLNCWRGCSDDEATHVVDGAEGSCLNESPWLTFNRQACDALVHFVKSQKSKNAGCSGLAAPVISCPCCHGLNRRQTFHHFKCRLPFRHLSMRADAKKVLLKTETSSADRNP